MRLCSSHLKAGKPCRLAIYGLVYTTTRELGRRIYRSGFAWASPSSYLLQYARYRQLHVPITCTVAAGWQRADGAQAPCCHVWRSCSRAWCDPLGLICSLNVPHGDSRDYPSTFAVLVQQVHRCRNIPGRLASHSLLLPLLSHTHSHTLPPAVVTPCFIINNIGVTSQNSKYDPVSSRKREHRTRPGSGGRTVWWIYRSLPQNHAVHHRAKTYTHRNSQVHNEKHLDTIVRFHTSSTSIMKSFTQISLATTLLASIVSAQEQYAIDPNSVSNSTRRKNHLPPNTHPSPPS